MRFRAYAKINLSLEVLGRRSDGYHDLASVMQTVSLCDVIDVSEGDDLRFSCSDASLEGDDNLVVRAARRLQQASQSRLGAGLALEKAIPHAAGLGGGSSDAAVTLKALNDRWSLHCSIEQLVDIASGLGSDIPFFLYGGTALVTGRGDVVRPLPDPDPVWFALVKPPIRVPTASVFRALSTEDWTDGAATRAVARRLCDGRGVTLGINGLQRALFALYPEARVCFEEISRAAPGRSFVSGSGPTVGALCRSRSEAEGIVGGLTGEGEWAAVVRSVGHAGE